MNLFTSRTTTGVSNPVSGVNTNTSFVADVKGTGAVSATVLIQARNLLDGTWLTLGTITLSGTSAAADGFGTLIPYAQYRANVTAISGNGAAVTVSMGA
jgi:malic enzyme